ncbi:MAG TPA: M28 family peptidase [Gemmatimonadaceae bacterium]|nr:M28 family peptidase [Gemmatimonadaceae bacterium]
MHTRIVLQLLLPAAVLAQQPQGALPIKHAPQPTTASISAADLMTRLYIFADDSMQGRETGTVGHLKSTDYIARELARLGLQPAGDSGTFFQTVPIVNRPFDVARSSLSVDGVALVPGVDFAPQQFRGLPRAFDGAQVIYGGVYGDTSTLPATADLNGKIVLFRGGRAGAAPAAFTSRVSGAAAIVRPSNALANTLRAATWPTANMLLRGSASAETPLTIMVTPRVADMLLGSSLDQATAGTLGKTLHGTIAFTETTAPARNVVAILRGRDPALRNEYVALGAHSDHVGLLAGEPVDHDSLHLYNQARFAIVGMVPRGVQQTPEQRARVDSIHVNYDSVRRLRPVRLDSIRNGADDDGSGSVTLLEIAEAFARAPMSARPRRSLLFVWPTGEEKGLLGSRWFSEHPTVPRDSIIAQLNMDMVGRGEPADIPVGAANYLELVGSRRLSTELGDIVEAVNRTQPRPFAFDYSFDAPGHPENIYCRSDHFHYARWGIPVVFFTTGLHGDYHQVTDEPQYISYEHMARIGQFVHDVALRVGNLDHRPVVDGVRMDPNGVCRQ